MQGRRSLTKGEPPDKPPPKGVKVVENETPDGSNTRPKETGHNSVKVDDSNKEDMWTWSRLARESEKNYADLNERLEEIQEIAGSNRKDKWTEILEITASLRSNRKKVDNSDNIKSSDNIAKMRDIDARWNRKKVYKSDNIGSSVEVEKDDNTAKMREIRARWNSNRKKVDNSDRKKVDNSDSIGTSVEVENKTQDVKPLDPNNPVDRSIIRATESLWEMFDEMKRILSVTAGIGYSVDERPNRSTTSGKMNEVESDTYDRVARGHIQARTTEETLNDSETHIEMKAEKKLNIAR